MRASGRWVALAVSFTAAAAPSLARADVVPSASSETKGYVELYVTASPGVDADAAALTASLRELCARLGLGLRAAPTGQPSATGPASPIDSTDRARVTVDESPADRVTIVIVPFRGDRAEAPVSRSLAKGDSSAILTEQVALVVHSTLESLFTSGDSLAAGPASAPSPPTPAQPLPASPPPAPMTVPAPVQPVVDHAAGPETPGRALSVAVMAFAAGRGVTGSAWPAFGAGGAVSASAWRGFGRPSFWLSGTYNAPFGEATRYVTVQTTVTSLRAGANVALVATKRFGLDVGAGAGADVFHAAPENAGPSIALDPAVDIVDPVITTRVLGGMRVVAGARVVVGIDVDYDVAPRRYVTALASGGHDAVVQPLPARPSLLVGLCLPLVGDLGCAP